MDLNRKGKVVRFIGVELLFLLIAIIVYNFVLIGVFENPIDAELKWAHKPMNDYVMSADNDTVYEEILLNVPHISSISLNGTAEDVSPESSIDVMVTHVDSGSVLANKSVPVYKAFDSEGKNFRIKLVNNEYTDGTFAVSIHLDNPGSTKVTLMANAKPGIVLSFNNNPDDKTNIVYRAKYGDVGLVSMLYFVVVFFLLLFVGILFWGIEYKSIRELFPFLMIVLGLMFQIVIPVGGAPDESWHIDTAYKYSNMLMGIDDSANAETIYKRKCDVIQSDMLGNNVEANSYYQLMHGVLRRADETELVEVSFTDASKQVLGIMYLPMALGITLGRLTGFSAMTAYVLGRLFAFAVYAALMYLAITLMPFGKNVTALIAMSPISLQQGGSASYDSMIIGAGAVFAAMVLRSLVEGFKAKWWDVALFVLSGLLLAFSKSGVYAPVVLVGIYFFFMKGKIASLDGKSKRRLLLVIAGIAIVLCICFIFVFKDILVMLSSTGTTASGEERYSIGYFMNDPGEFLRVFWNTIVEKTDVYFLGFMGGYLGWLTIKLGMVYAIPMFLIAVLLANADGDSLERPATKPILLAGTLGSIFLIMLGMLLADTALEEETIAGVQGRYFLPFATLLLTCLDNHFVNVSETDVKKLWKAGTFIEAVAILQVVVYAWK